MNWILTRKGEQYVLDFCFDFYVLLLVFFFFFFLSSFLKKLLRQESCCIEVEAMLRVVSFADD